MTLKIYVKVIDSQTSPSIGMHLWLKFKFPYIKFFKGYSADNNISVNVKICSVTFKIEQGQPCPNKSKIFYLCILC